MSHFETAMELIDKISEWCEWNPVLKNYQPQIGRRTGTNDLGVSSTIEIIVLRSFSILGLIKRNSWEMDTLYALKRELLVQLSNIFSNMQMSS